MASRTISLKEPFNIPQNTLNANGTIYTAVLGAPQEMSVKHIHVDIQKGQTILDLTPKQYLQLVRQGTLRKSEQHDFLVEMAKNKESNEVVKITLIIGKSLSTTPNLYFTYGDQ